jgi:hypothetical protein
MVNVHKQQVRGTRTTQLNAAVQSLVRTRRNGANIRPDQAALAVAAEYRAKIAARAKNMLSGKR